MYKWEFVARYQETGLTGEKRPDPGYMTWLQNQVCLFVVVLYQIPVYTHFIFFNNIKRSNFIFIWKICIYTYLLQINTTN